jgi:hypothetical protein
MPTYTEGTSGGTTRGRVSALEAVIASPPRIFSINRIDPITINTPTSIVIRGENLLQQQTFDSILLGDEVSGVRISSLLPGAATGLLLSYIEDMGELSYLDLIGSTLLIHHVGAMTYQEIFDLWTNEATSAMKRLFFLTLIGTGLDTHAGLDLVDEPLAGGAGEGLVVYFGKNTQPVIEEGLGLPSETVVTFSTEDFSDYVADTRCIVTIVTDGVTAVGPTLDIDVP